MPTVTTTHPRPTQELTTQELVERVKACFSELDAQAAYGRFVIERSLRPEVDFKAFRRLFAGAVANPHEITSSEMFVITHVDTLLPARPLVMVTAHADGTWGLVWANGMTGSEPVGPLPARFEEVA